MVFRCRELKLMAMGVIFAVIIISSATLSLSEYYIHNMQIMVSLVLVAGSSTAGDWLNKNL